MKYFLLAFYVFANAAHSQQTINDLTVKDLKVVSTTKGSKPCPLMTQVQRDAIASPLNGQCVYNTTTSKLNVYNGSIWKTADGSINSWATSTAYLVGDIVIQSSKIYQCLIAHTSGTFATDLAASKWVELANDVASSTGVLPTANGGTGSSNIGTGVVKASFGALSSATIVNADVSASAGIATTKLGALTASRIAVTDASGFLTTSSIPSSNLSGTNTGDQTITLTGDVTGSGTGSFATTIQDGSVDLASDVAGSLPLANLTAGANGTFLKTIGGVASWASLTAVDSPSTSLPTICGALFTSGGAITRQLGGCFSSCSASSAYSCNFTASYWATEPICVASAGGSGYAVELQSITTTTFVSRVMDVSTSAPANAPWLIICFGEHQ